MTDTQFYARMGDMADRLLAKFGTPATYRVFPPLPKPNAQGKVIKPTPIDTPGLAVRVDSKEVLDMFAEVGEVTFVAKFPTSEVKVQQHLIHAAKTWKIKEAKVVDPTGTSMLVAYVTCVKP